MRILGILQNAWARDPARVEQIIEMEKRRLSEPDFYAWRRAFTSRLMFAGRGKTAQRLGKFGFEAIEFEEASPKVGGRSASNFGFDRDHLVKVFTHYQPEVVVAFGKVTLEGVRSIGVLPCACQIIESPHPAARAADTEQKLKLISVTLQL